MWGRRRRKNRRGWWRRTEEVKRKENIQSRREATTTKKRVKAYFGSHLRGHVFQIELSAISRRRPYSKTQEHFSYVCESPYLSNTATHTEKLYIYFLLNAIHFSNMLDIYLKKKKKEYSRRRRRRRNGWAYRDRVLDCLSSRGGGHPLLAHCGCSAGCCRWAAPSVVFLQNTRKKYIVKYYIKNYI